MRLALAAAALALLAASCGGQDGERAPATLPPDALPELSSERRELDRAALAEDSFAPHALAKLLDEAGYDVGVEREFVGHGAVFDRVVARALRFESPQGAESYLRWIRRHGDDLLGDTESEPPLRLGSSGVLLALVRCGTCKKELPAYVAAWRRDDVVLSLLASGRGVDRERLAGLARELDGTMEA